MKWNSFYAANDTHPTYRSLCGGLHLRPDIFVLCLVEGALHPIEQTMPVGGDR
jgi:hypothetical protein